MKQCRGQVSMFSAEASLDLASHSVMPGSAEARKMTVTSGLRCLESYTNSGPLGYLVRTCLESSIWHSTRCFLTWKRKVTKSRRSLFQLAVSMPRIEETELLFWPTVRAHETGDYQYDQGDHNKKRPTLTGAVKLFPTPRVGGSLGSSPAGEKHGDLAAVVGGQLNPTWVEWLMGFPTGWTDLNA